MTEPAAEEKQQDPRYRLEENADGSAVVHLTQPVKYDGELHDRIFIPQLTGRHMRNAGWSYGEKLQVGQVVSFAAAIAEPRGIIDELPAALARDVAVEVVMMLGKSQKTG